MKTQKTLIKNLLLIAGISSFLIACDNGGQINEQSSPISEPDSTAEIQSQAPTEGNLVEVQLADYEIVMPDTIPAGETIFQVTNVGEVVHNFEIEGQGIEQEFETNLQPGETQTLQVDLEPGTYTVYCPVGNHAERGMTMELIVQQ